MKKDKKSVADAIMAGAKESRTGAPIPYFEGKEELDFNDGKPEKDDEEENITKAFTTLFNG
jgi:hypothetical protein